MSIHQELIHQELGKHVLNSLGELDFADMADKKAIMILEEIQNLFLSAKGDIGELSQEQSDFEILDQILSIFHRHGLKTGNLHNY
ncbi:MAG: hypothetical protein R3Y07_02150 [Eubacteriales bacterium]